MAYQWPDPHCWCYTVTLSDMAAGRNCCSLYRVNLGYAALWLVFFVVTSVSRSIPRQGGASRTRTTVLIQLPVLKSPSLGCEGDLFNFSSWIHGIIIIPYFGIAMTHPHFDSF